MSQLSKFPSKEYKTIYEYLHDYTGCSKKQKLMDDLSDFLYFEKLSWAYHNHRKFSPEVCLVTVSEPTTGEILDLGGSLPNDLFVDNFGTILSLMYRQPVATTAQGSLNVKDTGNTSRAICMYGTPATTNSFFASGGITSGSQIQVGSSTSAPARADVTIGTAFGTAPESALFNTSSGSYTAGTGTTTVSGSITAGNENGTINEAILVLIGSLYTSQAAETICQCHDSTTATAFSNAKSITVQYSLSD